jgi:hypothetical protein
MSADKTNTVNTASAEKDMPGIRGRDQRAGI